MAAHGAGFRGGTLYWPKRDEDQIKNKKKVFASKRVGFRFESM